MAILILLLASLPAVIIPTALFALILWWFDRYEKEPVHLLLVAFLWGAFPAVVFSLLAELMLDAPLSLLGSSADPVSQVVIAPIVEEVVKGAILVALVLFLRDEFDDPLDGIIYGALVGLGFNLTESLFTYWGAIGEGVSMWTATVFLRGFVFSQSHALFTGLTGLGLGLARSSPSRAGRWLWPAAGLAAAMTAHGLHNFGVTFVSAFACLPLLTFVVDWGGVLVLFVVMLLAWRQEKQWLTQELADETQRGLITEQQYALACSYGRRLSTQVNALGRGEWARRAQLSHWLQLLTELAFKKHQARAFAEDHAKEIDDLRGRIVPLSASVRVA